MGNVNKFSEKAYEIQMWGEIYNILQDRERDEHTEWGVTGKSETEQAKNYATGEFLWEDDEHTIPVMRDIYGTVNIADEDLNLFFGFLLLQKLLYFYVLRQYQVHNILNNVCCVLK